MGTVYKRGKFWWVAFALPGGGRAWRSTGIPSSHRSTEAKRVLASIESELARETVNKASQSLTVAEWAVEWTNQRKAARQTNATKDFVRLKRHVLPTIGSKRLGAVTVMDVRRLVASLRTSGLAARTVINTYGLVRRLFSDAAADELVVSSPCVLKRHDLPKKADKDPTWRGRALFTRDEVELILTSPLVPIDRRVVYAIAFLTGMREGEIAALRWSSIDRECSPLPCISVTTSFTRGNGYEKATKTGNPRQVPVHPTLQRFLEAWRTEGFGANFGRPPHPDDLVVPNRNGAHRTDNSFGKGLARDLSLLSLRRRRFHDLRRTFISLGRTDGANSDVLRTITHDQRGDQFDQYTTFTFEAKCDAIQCLRVTGRVTPQLSAITTAR